MLNLLLFVETERDLTGFKVNSFNTNSLVQTRVYSNYLKMHWLDDTVAPVVRIRRKHKLSIAELQNIVDSRYGTHEKNTYDKPLHSYKEIS